LVADAVRDLSLTNAMVTLQMSNKRAAVPLMKALKSAVANAINNANLDLDNLTIAGIMVNEGTAMKRFHPSTRGRVHPYKRRTSHITIVLKEKAAVAVDAAPVTPAVVEAEVKEEKKTAETKAKADKKEKKEEKKK
jgi:large subunit ribosomal protein L22